jgi:Mlc titration factor MtfA (ptsG expression regulator)
MGFFKKWRRQRILKHSLIPFEEWQATVENLPLLQGLSEDEVENLRELATIFLHEKSLEPTNDLVLTEEMQMTLAAQAVLPILYLGPDWYDGWTSVVLYPGEFVTRQEWTDNDGVVHSRCEILSGEAWDRGPVVLSWADVAASGHGNGYNTVIHEMAHKLDLLNGRINGLPPLHEEMRVTSWAMALSTAYEDFRQRVSNGLYTRLDPYAAEAPEEFFAVMSEHFFETPRLLNQAYPEVYAQLSGFYRQDPAARLASLR